MIFHLMLMDLSRQLHVSICTARKVPILVASNIKALVNPASLSLNKNEPSDRKNIMHIPPILSTVKGFQGQQYIFIYI